MAIIIKYIFVLFCFVLREMMTLNCNNVGHASYFYGFSLPS